MPKAPGRCAQVPECSSRPRRDGSAPPFRRQSRARWRQGRSRLLSLVLTLRGTAHSRSAARHEALARSAPRGGARWRRYGAPIMLKQWRGGGMATGDDLRRIALSLEGVSEAPHFDRAAFKVARIFATLAADGKTANLKFTPDEQEFKCLLAPDAFAPIPNAWGRQGWTVAQLSALDEADLRAALEIAWRHAQKVKRQKERSRLIWPLYRFSALLTRRRMTRPAHSPGRIPMAKPLIVVDPQPRDLDEIFDAPTRARFERLGDLVIHDGAGRMPAEIIERHLPDMALLIGQTDMPRERLERAANLRGDHQCRNQFPAERRLRDLLPARHPCAGAEFGFRSARRGNGARHGDRPLPRRHRRRPRLPRRRREMAARRRRGLLLALWRFRRPDRLWRSRPRLHAADRALRLPDQGL